MRDRKKREYIILSSEGETRCPDGTVNGNCQMLGSIWTDGPDPVSEWRASDAGRYWEARGFGTDPGWAYIRTHRSV